jgi:hypothetical protein
MPTNQTKKRNNKNPNKNNNLKLRTGNPTPFQAHITEKTAKHKKIKEKKTAAGRNQQKIY